ncbi:MAG: phospho-sugar mutase, partial [Alistipes sp.]|nr:phospho-sugar mutase [Alistipes sp.]
MDAELEKKVLARAQRWLDGNYDEATKERVRYLIEHDRKELMESFYKDLEFGTAGLRGIMGVGSNRMNIYTVGAATQGLSNYLKRNFAGEEVCVAVAHDSRNNSRMFAEHVADIFASNGFRVFLFDALRPTPELSFAIRELGCQSGVVVTASHNPKEYNGYKVYWSDGAQITEPHDKNITAEVERITEVDQILCGRNPENIEILGEEFDDRYLAKILELSLSPRSVERFHDLRIVYSPMHGAGVRLVPESLRRFGFTDVRLVPEQAVIDGNFPTVKSPNPEERETMSMAIALAEQVKADLVLATDPDSDRIGVALPDENGNYVLLNGNQTLALLLSYQLTRWAELGRLDGREYVIKTIVTSQMANAVADFFGVRCYDCLTGFKHIAKIIRRHETERTGMRYIGGGEESFGYLAGDYVRDKDGVSACSLAAEAAAWARDTMGISLYEWLKQLYVKYGFYQEG